MYYKSYSLDIFKQVPREIVFAIENRESKKVYVNETKNGLFGLARLIHENPELLELNGQLVVHMLETNESFRKHYVAIVMDKYLEDGYELLNIKKPLQYIKAKIIYKNDKFQIVLVNNRNNTELIGEFDNYEEAKTFYETYYSKSIPYPLVTYL
jgi:hypothetical protein